jgi:hypothetical protein
MSIYEQQRDILFEACKKVATAQNCPKWIADLLRTEVMRAKQLKEEFPSLSNDQESHVPDQPLQVNEIVVINNNGARCVAKLLNEAIPVDGIRLFDVQVVENSKNHNIGTIFHNIPETMMTRK